jgi:hypothetical protein
MSEPVIDGLIFGAIVVVVNAIHAAWKASK